MVKKRLGDHLSSPCRNTGDQDVGAACHDTDGLVPLAGVVRAVDLAPVGRRDVGVPGAGEARGGTGSIVVATAVVVREPAAVVIVIVIIV
eukprot:432243-Prymnesium_polylepis.1